MYYKEIVMKFLVPILVALGIMTSVSSITLPQTSGSMMGKWSFYGTLSPKTDYRAKDFDRADIDTLQEILQYTDCIPGYEVTLTPAGVTEYLDNKGYKLESWEKLSDNEYCMTLKTVKSGERQIFYYTMIGDLLYEEMKYENTKYLPPEIVVYRK